ncbi:MAG: oligoribonuclease [Myxococcota bacterium]
MNSKTRNLNPQRLVWIDLEMTGLDENTCAIVQAAMVITDLQLNEIASIDMTIWQPDSVLAGMVPFVKNMHTHNGLLKKVRASEVSLQDAERKLMEVLTQHVVYQRGFLAGNSIYMDRLFLRKYMPALEGYLHYRQVDVSSIKILCQEWLKTQAPKKESTHTALDDIQQSIEELKYFRNNCFRLP